MKIRSNILTGPILFLLSAIVFLFWLLARTTDIYRYPVVSAVFEILWLPMVLLVFLMPLLLFYLWWKDKYAFQSWYFFGLLITVLSVLMMIFFQS